ncbi:phage head closure protein [Butyrivibrio sp. FC2001]|uniref:phage head closure protein n=1 Tax=Butyrivibrio sp. FC2001 TaxID=1280671 RepID=UPI00047E53B4|nr:phage head closure protein [Butyrivibrio sp. FC2001]
MKISRLSEKVIFQKGSAHEDEYGNHVMGYDDYFSCSCTVSSQVGDEKEDAVTMDEEIISFTVRYSSETECISGKEYRIIFRGKYYNIVSVDYQGYRKKSIKFKCKHWSLEDSHAESSS